MDKEHKLDEGLVKALFENGLMGVEAESAYGGSECNFMTMMLVVEELSKGAIENLILKYGNFLKTTFIIS